MFFLPFHLWWTLGLVPHYLLWIVLLWTWVYKHLFEKLFSVLLGMHSEVETLTYISILAFMCWGTAVLFSIEAVPYCIPTNNAYVTNTCYFLPSSFPASLPPSLQMGVRWYLTVVFICIHWSLVILSVFRVIFGHVCNLRWRSVYSCSLHNFESFVAAVVIIEFPMY